MITVRLAQHAPVEVRKEDHWLAKDLGMARDYIAKQQGRKRVSGYGKYDSLQSNIGGVLAEIIIARALNLWPNLISFGSDPGFDCRLHDDRTIDVKWNPSGKDLMVSERKKDKPAALYFLFYGDPYDKVPTELRFGGWASKERLFQDRNLRDYGNGDWCYVVESNQLIPIWEGIA